MSRGRRRIDFLNICSSCKNRNRYVIQGLLLLKNNFFIKSSVFELVPWESPESPLKIPCRSRTLGPLGDIQRTSRYVACPAGTFIWTNKDLYSSVFSFILYIHFYCLLWCKNHLMERDTGKYTKIEAGRNLERRIVMMMDAKIKVMGV